MAADTNSPLYLHPNDGSYTISVGKLTGAADYKSWRRSMEIALTAKKKIGFVLGTVLRSTYAQDSVKADQWDTCNPMVITWIHACLSDTIKKSVLYVNSARETWVQLEKRFSMSNGSRKYKLNRDLYKLRQNNNPINVYYTSMTSLWEEIDSMNVLPAVTETSAEIRNFAMRTQLLMLTPLPTVESACSMLQQEESQREVLNLSGSKLTLSAMYSRGGAVVHTNSETLESIR
uniref:Retrotransposon Copia-like N-terminal domain-containing protein n=1 Tax=Chenopodium quinoa TaxID=63459 RepID=A0A803LDK4_CHEQI